MRLPAAAVVALLLITAPAAAQDRTGVRDCDDFIQWFAACMQASNVPAQAQPIFQAALEQMRSGWRSMADTSDGRAALARSCRDYGNQMRQQMAGFGCRP